MLVDSHCHLDFPDFAEELDEVMARAAAAGVGTVLTICTRLTAFAGVRAISERYENAYCSIGIHPHDVAAEPAVTAADLVRAARHSKVIGLGETGLDYYYEHSARDRQQASFRTHVRAARESGLPLIVHSRDADADMARILEEEHARGRFTGVIHCFTGGPELAERVLAIGFYISFSGIVTFKRSDDLRDIARSVPIDRILIETDSPYLAPVPKRGKRNEPAYVAYTAAQVAAVRSMDIRDFSVETTRNFFRLFTKASRPGGGGGGVTCV